MIADLLKPLLALVVATLWLGAMTAPAQFTEDGDEITLQTLLAEMMNRSAVTRFPVPAYKTLQASSYDRASVDPADHQTWFANADYGQFLRTEQRHGRTENVLMDANGPGAIVRFWSANPAGTLRIYLDGAEEPAVEAPMADLLAGKVLFGEPLGAVQSRGYNLYAPIPYAKRCVVTSDTGGFYYQINYRTYEASARVRTFSMADYDAAASAIENTRQKLREFPRPIGEGAEVNVFVPPGEERSLGYSNGPAQITGISLKMVAPDIDAGLRSVVLIGEFDGARTVEVPLGDFFGTAPGINEFQNWYSAVRTTGRMMSLWRMPFERRGELKVVNMGTEGVTIGASVFHDGILWNEDSMHFHARWRSEYPIRSRPMRDWNYLTVEGRGVLVGDSLSVANPLKSWWGEGDEKIYVDGERFPSHFGTGTEDYYGYAWCDTGLFSSPFHSQSRCDGPGNYGHTSVNRVRLLDGITFGRGLKFDMEVWTAQESDVAYTATTYFYARPGARVSLPAITPEMVASIPTPAPLQVFRIENALEAEDLTVLNTNPEDLSVSIQDVDVNGISGGQHLWVRATAAQQGVDLELPVARPGRNRVLINLTRSWDYAIVQCQVKGENAGAPVDLFNAEIAATGLVDLGVFDLGPKARLRVVTTGSNPASRDPKFFFGIDAVKLVPVED